MKQFNPILQLLDIMKNANIDKQTENIIMNQIVGKAQRKNVSK